MNGYSLKGVQIIWVIMVVKFASQTKNYKQLIFIIFLYMYKQNEHRKTYTTIIL